MSLRLAACLIVCTISGGCASSPKPESPEPDQPRSVSARPEVASRPELNLDEESLRDRLARHVNHLSRDIGERNPDKPWELAEASDYIARQFEEMGYPIERQGYEAKGVAAQNLVVTVGGGRHGDQQLVVAAHYDSPPGDPGANPGGTGTAAILELARIMKDAKLTRTLKFVVFAMGESPHGDGQARGGRQYVQKLLEKSRKREQKLEREQQARQRGDIPAALPPLDLDRSQVMGMIALDRLGSFEAPESNSESNGGTRSPAQRPVHVRISASPSAEKLVESLLAPLEEEGMVVHESLLPQPGDPNAAETSIPDSDQAAFQQAGIPAVWVHGSGGSEAPDLDAMALVVMRLRAAIGQIVGEKHLQGSPYTAATGKFRDFPH